MSTISTVANANAWERLSGLGPAEQAVDLDRHASGRRLGSGSSSRRTRPSEMATANPAPDASARRRKRQVDLPPAPVRAPRRAWRRRPGGEGRSPGGPAAWRGPRTERQRRRGRGGSAHRPTEVERRRSNVISNPNPIVTAEVPRGSMRPTSSRCAPRRPAGDRPRCEPADDDRDHGGGDGEAQRRDPRCPRGSATGRLAGPSPASAASARHAASRPSPW